MWDARFYLLRSTPCTVIDNRLTSTVSSRTTSVDGFLYHTQAISLGEVGDLPDKHRCRNTTFVNAFPNTIREICNRVLGRMIFFENLIGREIAVFARLFQGSSKPPVKRKWDGSYPYTSYPHLFKVISLLHIFHSSGTAAEEIERFITAVSGAQMLGAIFLAWSQKP